jgi:alanyl aminopeptidase
MDRLYRAQMAEPENRAATWQWLAPNFDALRKRLSPFAQSRVPETFTEGRCSGVDADEVAAFFMPRIEDLIGGERGLGQTLEGIRQCGALREHLDRKALADWVAVHGADAK